MKFRCKITKYIARTQAENKFGSKKNILTT